MAQAASKEAINKQDGLVLLTILKVFEVLSYPAHREDEAFCPS